MHIFVSDSTVYMSISMYQHICPTSCSTELVLHRIQLYFIIIIISNRLCKTPLPAQPRSAFDMFTPLQLAIRHLVFVTVAQNRCQQKRLLKLKSDYFSTISLQSIVYINGRIYGGSYRLFLSQNKRFNIRSRVDN